MATGAATALGFVAALAAAATPAAAELPVVSYLLSNFQRVGLAQGSSSAIRSLDDTLYFWGLQIPVGSEHTTSDHTWLSVDGDTAYECGIERVTLKTICWGTDKAVCERRGVGEPVRVPTAFALSRRDAEVTSGLQGHPFAPFCGRPCHAPHLTTVW